MEHGKLFLNKVIQEGDITQLTRHKIKLSDMPTEADRETMKFINKYASENNGQVPSYAVVATEVDGFEYVPDVSDNYFYLAKKIKEQTALKEVLGWFTKKEGNQSEFEKALNELGIDAFLKKWLPEKSEKVIATSLVRDKLGTNVKDDVESFIEEYDKRKTGESIRVWKSKFSCIGEYISSNLYTVYGRSGRGKSVITLEEGVYAAMQGANVLLWALEMGRYEVLVRIYASISGNVGASSILLNGVNMASGFNATDIRKGSLNDDFEEAFKDFLRNMNENMEGNIVVRAVDDDDFDDRTLSTLESDIKNTDADFVIIDPFYYLTYEANTSRTTGGDAANTSMKLRRLAGKTSTVIIAITQADEVKDSNDDEGSRELELPSRNEVKKTSSLLEDAYLLIAVDTDYLQGRGLVGVNKGRDGGEGINSDIMYIPNYAIVKEMPKSVGDDEFVF